MFPRFLLPTSYFQVNLSSEVVEQIEKTFSLYLPTYGSSLPIEASSHQHNRSPTFGVDASDNETSAVSAQELAEHRTTLEQNAVGTELGTIFDAAFSEIANLLQTDVFLRFQASPGFEKFKQLSVYTPNSFNFSAGDIKV